MAPLSESVCPFARLPVCPFKPANRPTGQPANRLNGPTGQRANGQSILEYLILIAVLLLAILTIRVPLGSAVKKLYNAATGKVDQAANNLIAM